ncbi:MAG: hypothetical protein M1837_000255 [Sclerophora amabilis]|nr:MAG: hypothetical protein M1837_000255 [Sclerophora amabilis]
MSRFCQLAALALFFAPALTVDPYAYDAPGLGTPPIGTAGPIVTGTGTGTGTGGASGPTSSPLYGNTTSVDSNPTAPTYPIESTAGPIPTGGDSSDCPSVVTVTNTQTVTETETASYDSTADASGGSTSGPIYPTASYGTGSPQPTGPSGPYGNGTSTEGTATAGPTGPVGPTVSPESSYALPSTTETTSVIVSPVPYEESGYKAKRERRIRRAHHA